MTAERLKKKLEKKNNAADDPRYQSARKLYDQKNHFEALMVYQILYEEKKLSDVQLLEFNDCVKFVFLNEEKRYNELSPPEKTKILKNVLNLRTSVQNIIDSNYKKPVPNVRLEAKNLYNLAFLFNHPLFTPNQRIAAEYYKKCYEVESDIGTANNLGNIYLNGDENNGLPVNLEESFKWFQKAAKLGGTQETFEKLYECYANGRGCPKDTDKAIEYAEKEYKLSLNPQTACNLGILYKNKAKADVTKEETKNSAFKEAFDWFTIAGKSGFRPATIELFSCYYHGVGCSKNYLTAIEWGKKAYHPSQQGKIAHDIGLIYEALANEADFKEVYYKEAFYWFQLAANDGCSEAKLCLSDYYSKGIGCGRNYGLAANWAGKALVENPDSGQLATHLAAYILLDHINSSHDITELSQIGFPSETAQKIYSLLHKGYLQEIADAALFLGFCYEFGISVKADFKKAAEYYLQAKKWDSRNSEAIVDRLINVTWREFLSTKSLEALVKDLDEIDKGQETPETQPNKTEKNQSPFIGSFKEIFEQRSLSPELKLQSLLELYAKTKNDINPINLSYLVLLISRLIEKSNFPKKLYNSKADEIKGLIETCRKTLEQDLFDTQSKINLITGLSKFNSAGYDNVIEKFLLMLYQSCEKDHKKQALNCLELSSICAAALLNPLAPNADGIYPVNFFALRALEQSGRFISSGENVANLFYNLAVLDHGKKINLVLEPEKIKELLNHAFKQLTNSTTKREDKDQYFMFIAYFMEKFKVAPDAGQKYALQQYKNSYKPQKTQSSRFQDNLGTLLKQAYGKKVASEKLYNFLPVDFSIESSTNQTLVFQADGFHTHFYLGPNHREQSLKDKFHDYIIQSGILNDGLDSKKIQIIHIWPLPWDEFLKMQKESSADGIFIAEFPNKQKEFAAVNSRGKQHQFYKDLKSLMNEAVSHEASDVKLPAIIYYLEDLPSNFNFTDFRNQVSNPESKHSMASILDQFGKFASSGSSDNSNQPQVNMNLSQK